MKTHLLSLDMSSEKPDLSGIDGNMSISKYRDEIRDNMFFAPWNMKGNFILIDNMSCNPASIITEYM